MMLSLDMFRRCAWPFCRLSRKSRRCRAKMVSRWKEQSG